MKQDEVLNLARQVDGHVTMWVNHSTIQKTTTFTFESPIDYYVSGDYPELYHIKFLERFANLVAAKEREALAQPEQEPVGRFAKFTDGIWRQVTDYSAGVPLYTSPPQRTEQELELEPAWPPATPPAHGRGWPLAEPPLANARECTWVGLTDEEIDSCFEDHGWSPSEDYYPVIKAIEAKLKEKNT